MITVESTPALVAITGNPVRFKLSTDNVVDTAGGLAVMNITFTAKGLEANGNGFTLNWGALSIPFICKASPDDSGNEISDGTVEPDLNAWVAMIATEIQANYYINRDYVVTASTNVLTLTAIRTGSAYSLAMTKDWHTYPPTETHTDGVGEVLKTFYKLGLQILLKVGESWEQIGEDILPVDADLEATFDIHRLFADRVYSEFKYPEASDQILTKRDYHCREYRIRYFEQYGSPITPGKLTESSSYYILAAGISHLQEAIYNRQASSLWAKLGYNQYFLTWSPVEKLIDRYTTEKLYYLVRSSIASLEMKIEIHYNDSTPTSTIIKSTVASPVDKAVYEVVCSLNVLQLTGYDQNTIDYYRVWMEDGSSDRISEIRTFRMDYANHEEVRQFLFRNSLGGYDTLRTTGIVSSDLEHERTTLQKVLGPDFTEADHQVAAGSVSEVQTYKANTGWKSREDIAWIRDFLLSKQVYQLVVGKLIPIVITSPQAHQATDREDLYSIDFEYRRAFRSEFYSREIVTAAFTDAFNDDFTNE